jgi:hypothetical protein
MGHSSLIFVAGIGLIIALLTFGAATNMRRSAEGPEVASEYRMAREVAITGLNLAKARLADDYTYWYTGFTISNTYQLGSYSATVTMIDTGWVEIRSTGLYGRGEYLVKGGYVVVLDDDEIEGEGKVLICHVHGSETGGGSCESNPYDTISINWNAWEGGPKHSQHTLVCTDPDTGATSTFHDTIGPCGAPPFLNVSGVQLLEYSEWRIMD